MKYVVRHDRSRVAGDPSLAPIPRSRDTPDVRANSLTRLLLTAYGDHVIESRPASTAPEVALGRP